MPADQDPRTPDEIIEDRVALHMLDKMPPGTREDVLGELTLVEREQIKHAQYWERKAGRR